MIQLTGRLHPLLVHLPIGILLLACFFQLAATREKFRYLQPAISITLFWGMICAIASCITGYLLSGTGDYDEIIVNRHQWFGISVAVVSVIYFMLYQYKKIIGYTWLLPVVLIFLIIITGHLGGSLTHGSDYLNGGFNTAGTNDTIRRPVPDVQEAVAYTDIVQPVLQSKCYSCHGANKQKGKLRMDLPDALMKGGKDGIVIEAGQAAASELMRRILLEKGDEHHMPPKEKPQLTEKETALLHWWIESGASFTKKTKDLPQPEKMKVILLSLQTNTADKKQPADIPGMPVEKADESAIEKLRSLNVVITPVAVTSNYLMVSFVTASTSGDTMMQLLLPFKKQLVRLNVSDTKITDAGMKIIGQCTNVSRLEMANTLITDNGLEKLKGLTALQSVNLTGTHVTAAGLLMLKELPKLRTIYFYHTAVKSMDWPALQKAFPVAVLDSGGYTVPLFQTDTMLVQPPVIVK